MTLLLVIAGQFGVGLVLGVIWTQVGRLGRRAKKSPSSMVWIQTLALVVFGCAVVGPVIILAGRTPTDRLWGWGILAAGAAAGLGAWVLWRRVPVRDAPGTTESFSVSIVATGDQPWPTLQRAKDAYQIGPGERELVTAPVWLDSGLQPIHARLQLTDRRLVVTHDGQRLEIPRSRVESVTYRIKGDRITIVYRTESGPESADLTTPQLVWHGGPTGRTHQLFEALRTGFLNPKSIGAPMLVEGAPNPRRWIVAGAVFVVLAGIGFAFLTEHYLGLRSAAQTYNQAPTCASASLGPCRRLERATFLQAGTGRHPDGQTGSQMWLLLHLDNDGNRIADLPQRLADVPARGEAIELELWGERITKMDIDGQMVDTYANPDWTARNYLTLIGVVIFLALLIMAAFGTVAWKDLSRVREQSGLARAA